MVVQGLNWPHVMQMGGFQGERATVKKKKNKFFLQPACFYADFSQSFLVSWFNQRAMDGWISLCYALTTSSKGKGFSSHPVKQLLCSPLPELLYLQESLEAVGVNRLVSCSSGILQPLSLENGETLTVVLTCVLSKTRARQATMPGHYWQHRAGTFACCI